MNELKNVIQAIDKNAEPERYSYLAKEYRRRHSLCPDCGGNCEQIKDGLKIALGNFSDVNSQRAYYSGQD